MEEDNAKFLFNEEERENICANDVGTAELTSTTEEHGYYF